MMRVRVLLALMMAAGCSDSAPNPPQPAPVTPPIAAEEPARVKPAPVEPSPPDPVRPSEAAGEVSDDIRSFAASYETLPLVSEHMVDMDLLVRCMAPPPGEEKERLELSGPHALGAVRIFRNETARDADSSGPYPMGAVIVKEKARYGLSDDTLDARAPRGVGGMIKRAPGYDPEGGDWEWFYFDEDQHMTAGRLDNCRTCHRKATATDFVFGHDEWPAGYSY